MNGITYWPLSKKKAPPYGATNQATFPVPERLDSPDLYAYQNLANYSRFVSADRVPVPGPTILASIPIHEKNDSPNLFAYQALIDFPRFISSPNIKPSLGPSVNLNTPIPERLDLTNYNVQYGLLDLKGSIWPSAPPQVFPVPKELDQINYVIQYNLESDRPPIAGPVAQQTTPLTLQSISYPTDVRNYDQRTIPFPGEVLPQPKLLDSISFQTSYAYSDRFAATISSVAPVPQPVVPRLLDSPDLYKYDALRNYSRFTSDLRVGAIQGAVVSGLAQLKPSDLTQYALRVMGLSALDRPGLSQPVPVALVPRLLDPTSSAYSITSYGLQNSSNPVAALPTTAVNQTFHFKLDGVNAYWFVPPKIDYTLPVLVPETGQITVFSFESLLPSIGMGR